MSGFTCIERLIIPVLLSIWIMPFTPLHLFSKSMAHQYAFLCWANCLIFHYDIVSFDLYWVAGMRVTVISYVYVHILCAFRNWICSGSESCSSRAQPCLGPVSSNNALHSTDITGLLCPSHLVALILRLDSLRIKLYAARFGLQFHWGLVPVWSTSGIHSS